MKLITAALAAVTLTASLAACGSGDEAAPAKPATSKPSPSKPTKAQAAPAKPKVFWEDGDWSISKRPTLSSSVLGWFTGKATVTYNGGNPRGGDICLDLDVFDTKENPVASLMGCVSNVKPGRNAIVEFIGTEDYKAGTYSVEVSKSW